MAIVHGQLKEHTLDPGAVEDGRLLCSCCVNVPQNYSVAVLHSRARGWQWKLN